MPDVPSKTRIFISYRRDDSAKYADRIFERLQRAFGRDRVFQGTETIEPGMRFDRAIESAVAACDVLLALIGPGWLDARDGSGRRLDRPDDFVRLEIAAALRRDVLVIPVLLDGAVMPTRSELPPEIANLALHHAVSFGQDDWPRQMAKVERSIQSVVKLRGLGLKVTLGQQYCPVCGEALPTVRRPRGWREALLGGFTCPECGTRLDRLARVIR